jgi:hypothetical protein
MPGDLRGFAKLAILWGVESLPSLAGGQRFDSLAFWYQLLPVLPLVLLSSPAFSKNGPIEAAGESVHRSAPTGETLRGTHWRCLPPGNLEVALSVNNQHVQLGSL